MPDMYMKRFLKVGDASWKIVWQPGSWHIEITAQAEMRGSCAVDERAEERAEARARHGDLAHVDLGPLGKPVAHALPVATQLSMLK